MRKAYRDNHTRAWCYFIGIGLLPVDAKKNEWCLHHKDTELKFSNPERYDEWNVEDLVPMKKSEHTRLHQKGRHHSEHTKSRISNSLKGHTVGNDTRKKISESGKGRTSWLKGTHGLITSPMKGKHHTEEAKKKLSESHKGRVQNEYEKLKRAETLRKVWSDKKLKDKQKERVSASVWITNGTENRRIDRDKEIPEGWTLGRSGGWKWRQS